MPTTRRVKHLDELALPERIKRFDPVAVQRYLDDSERLFCAAYRRIVAQWRAFFFDWFEEFKWIPLMPPALPKGTEAQAERVWKQFAGVLLKLGWELTGRELERHRAYVRQPRVRDFAIARLPEPAANDSFVKPIPDAVWDYYQQYALKIKGVTDEGTLREVRGIVQKGALRGWSVPETRTALGELFDSMSRARLENIARTEAARIYGSARWEHYRTEADIQGYEYSAVLDQSLCNVCSQFHGRYFTPDEALRYWPPQHQQCRCVLCPTWPGEDVPALGADTIPEGVGPLPGFGQPLGDLTHVNGTGEGWGPLQITPELPPLLDGPAVRGQLEGIPATYNAERAEIQAELDRRQVVIDRLYAKADKLPGMDNFPAGSPPGILAERARQRAWAAWERKVQDSEPLVQKLYGTYDREREAVHEVLSVPVEARSTLRVSGSEYGGARAKGAEFLERVTNGRVLDQLRPLECIQTSEMQTGIPGQRGYYDAAKGQPWARIVLRPEDVRPSAVVHEVGHHLETDAPGVQELAHRLLLDRTTGEESVPLAQFDPSYQPYEMTKKDKFIDPYTGRQNSLPHTEVISMGMQHLYEDPMGFALKDPEHFDLTVNTLRGTHKR